MHEALAVLKDIYFDSVMLMAAAARVKSEHSLAEAAFFMGSEANRKLLTGVGFAPPDSAGAGDVILAVRGGDADVVQSAIESAKAILLDNKQASSSGDCAAAQPRSLGTALRSGDAGLAVVSIPGQYVEAEAGLALAMGLNAFIFSDNVPLEAEIRLKQLAVSKNLLCMGPDCGTGWLDGYGVGFSNAVPRGRIGIVSASGTGLQAVACHLADLGEGLSQGIGVGGRDLSAGVGGAMTLAALDRLEHDPATELVIIISKPPSPEVMERLESAVAAMTKPVVACIQGAVGAASPSGKLYWARTLVDAARTAVAVLQKLPRSSGDFDAPDEIKATVARLGKAGGRLMAAYTGGTLAHEAELLIKPILPDLVYGDETALQNGLSCVLDFGDDQYTQGRPHPMIDPSSRNENMLRLASGGVDVILFDLVLGRCSHRDPAGEFITAMQSLGGGKNGPVFVGSVAGTDGDVQNRTEQIRKLRDAGAIVMPDNAQAALLAALLVKPDAIESLDMTPRLPLHSAGGASGSAESVLFASPFSVANIGVDMFADSLAEQGANILRVDWRPPVSQEIEEARLCLAGMQD